jgi:hypothetical protein
LLFKLEYAAVCERAAMYPDGAHGRGVNVACQVHSRDAAPSATTLGTDGTWERLLAETVRAVALDRAAAGG